MVPFTAASVIRLWEQDGWCVQWDVQREQAVRVSRLCEWLCEQVVI